MRCFHPKNMLRLTPNSCNEIDCPRVKPLQKGKHCSYERSEETIAVVGVNEKALRVCIKCGFEAHTLEELKLFRNRPKNDPNLSYYPYGKDAICLKCNRKYDRERKKRANKTNPKPFREKAKKFYRKNPDKVIAGYIARKYLKPKDKCEICGSTENLSMHHPDYNNPLEVVTLCGSCHRKANYDMIRVIPNKKSEAET